MAPTPRWDPVGDRIAYCSRTGGRFPVVNGDGTGARVISAPGRSYESGTFDWSLTDSGSLPVESTRWNFLNVASGLTLLFGYSSNMNMPTWRPITPRRHSNGALTV